MNLQSILYPKENICNEEALYLHRDGSFILFDGFFNLFYLEKHKTYCNIENLSLELKVKGIKRIFVMHDKDVACEVQVDVIVPSGMERLVGKVPTWQVEQRLSIQLPYNAYDKGVLWFKAEICDENDGWELSGYYCAVIENNSVDEKCRSVELAVNICTYKREQYVTRNMRALMDWKNSVDIDGNTPVVADHMHVFIVDNAGTLSSYDEFSEVCEGNLGDGKLITVIPNANTGGAGGFGRGMTEAIKRRDEFGLTHLLMMDDDAVFDPEIFVRLYGFLFTLKDEYKEITVGGGLMREDYPFIQHAAGEWYSGFKVYNDHLMADLRDFDVCTSDWMTAASYDEKIYGAWWCCCYHMNAVTEENLPLPIFVHHDDIQFGLKQRGRGIVFLNGICVWHQGFELVFPGVKQYYNMRNTLITSALFEPEYLRKHLKVWVIKRYIGMLVSYRYGDCEFVYKGLMDFLKGKKWLVSSDPEGLHKELMAMYREICPFDKFYGDVGLSSELRDVSEEAKKLERLREYYSHSRFESSIIKKATFNGWFLPADKELKIITPLDSPWATYRHKSVLLYEPATGKGCVMKRSNREFFKGIWRIVKMAFAVDLWKISGGKWE
ncbi:glycosyltransferase [Butyrivibrio sp. AE3003]|uniref:glycosyltransferase n=1 Tax=Butyrivibrio sp. AE3003 TaxID=1496721 RepID=UPI00047A5C07|nr:glycosyltransferase [Butyrivibrio sp. AE3003]